MNTAIKVRAEADQAGATVRLRVYTDADELLRLGGAHDSRHGHGGRSCLPLRGLCAGSVRSRVRRLRRTCGAIDLLIETNTDATDGIVTLLGAFAPIAVTENITNELDLAIDKTVNNPTPTVGQHGDVHGDAHQSRRRAGATASW